MHKLPRSLSGERLADHLCQYWKYVYLRQSGSHILPGTDTLSRRTQAVPCHSPLKVGTLSAILGQVATHKGLTREDILRDLQLPG